MCPVCRGNVELNTVGVYAMHRAPRRDRFTFCPMSGQPVPVNAEVTG
jgi:hypothetical protein